MGIIPLRNSVKVVPSFYDLNMVIFGLQKSGKTSFLSGDKDCVTIACEPGSDFVASRPVEVKHFSTFGNVLKEMSVNPLDYSGIVIDTVDALYQLCFDRVCEQRGVRYPPQNDYGRTHFEIAQFWEKSLQCAIDIAPLRFISHSDIVPKTLVEDSGLEKEYQQIIQRFHGKKSRFLDATVNCVGYMSVRASGTRVLSFAHTAYVAGGDRTGILEKLGDIELPKVPSEGFSHVAQLYQEKAQEMGFEVTKRMK